MLLTGTASGKADRTEAIVRLWEAGSITLPVAGRSYMVPDRPARDGDKVCTLVLRTLYSVSLSLFRLCYSHLLVPLSLLCLCRCG